MEAIDAFHSKNLEKNSQKPGFETWYSVIIDTKEKKSVWLKYNTFIPLKIENYSPATVVWASFFDYKNPENNFCYANSSFLASLSVLDNIYNFSNGTITVDKFNGFFNTDKEVEWEFNFEHRNKPLKYAYGLLETFRILKANAFLVSPFGFASGYFKINDKKFNFKNSQSTMIHLSGTSLIEDMIWVYAPQFDGDLEGWQLEIISFRQGIFFPRYTFVTLFDGQNLFVNNIVEAMANITELNYPQVEFDLRIKDYKLKVKANFSEQVNRLIYKNPDETNRYVIRSDISSLTIDVNSLACKRNLKIENSCTIEIISNTPYDKENYFDPFDNE
ncbi:MAG: hypothetical protein KatS3mg068_2553 [Candidatus Sericytochromatia bacterium]|nr:MAG: hypothetical protein KatS3mg068_2553 [Candidatus Sericytochromatia bacterium]